MKWRICLFILLYLLLIPEGSNHHSHENPTFIHDPRGVMYFGVSTAVAPALRVCVLLSEPGICSPSEAEERSRGEKPRRAILIYAFFTNSDFKAIDPKSSILQSIL